MRLPLEDVTVLDLCHALAGPFCSTMLADFGARVIKLEPKGAGDIARAWGTPLPGGETAYFVSLHRNKQGIEVDLKHPEGKELFFKLVERADVVLENYRTGALERLGLAYEEGRKRNPGIIYCSVSGFGQDGPYRDRAALDLILQAESGMISVTGEEGGRGVRCGHLGRRHDGGHVRGLRHHAGAAREGEDGPRPGHRRVHARGPDVAARHHDRRLPRRRRAARADGHRLQGAAPVPDVPDEDARSGAGGGQREALADLLSGHRPARAGERPALSQERRPRRRTAPPSSRSSRRSSSPRPTRSGRPSSCPRASPSAPSTTSTRWWSIPR